jgi:hypothetical protein
MARLGRVCTSLVPFAAYWHDSATIADRPRFMTYSPPALLPVKGAGRHENDSPGVTRRWDKRHEAVRLFGEQRWDGSNGRCRIHGGRDNATSSLSRAGAKGLRRGRDCILLREVAIELFQCKNAPEENREQSAFLHWKCPQTRTGMHSFSEYFGLLVRRNRTPLSRATSNFRISGNSMREILHQIM